MAEFVTSKITVALATITGFGARAKHVTETILSICDDLTIENVNSDTADNYSVDLSWRGSTDWLIRVSATNSNLYFYLMTQTADGAYESKSSGYVSVLSSANVFVEINKHVNDLLLVGVHAGSNVVSFMCLEVVDQFTGVEKFAAAAGSSSYSYYSPGTLYIAEGPNVVRLLEDKNANGLTPNDIVAAIPVVHYTESSATPFSGFVAGGDLLYYFYRGTAAINADARHTNRSLGGHNFITLTRNLCVRID